MAEVQSRRMERGSAYLTTFVGIFGFLTMATTFAGDVIDPEKNVASYFAYITGAFGLMFLVFSPFSFFRRFLQQYLQRYVPGTETAVLGLILLIFAGLCGYIGLASKALASTGGVAGSVSPGIAKLQEALGFIQKDTAKTADICSEMLADRGKINFAAGFIAPNFAGSGFQASSVISNDRRIDVTDLKIRYAMSLPNGLRNFDKTFARLRTSSYETVEFVIPARPMSVSVCYSFYDESKKTYLRRRLIAKPSADGSKAVNTLSVENISDFEIIAPQNACF